MKRIYLDQNKWIKLARTWYGKENDALSKELISKIENLVAQKKIIIPFSVVNFIETAKPEDKDRRERLARFMYKLSDGFAILPFYSVREYEFKNAIAEKLDKTKLFDIEGNAVSKDGLAFSLGAEIEVPDEFNEFKSDILREINNEDSFVLLVQSLIDRKVISDIKQEDLDILKNLEKGRENLDKYDQLTCLKHSVVGMALELIPTLTKVLHEMGIDVREFTDNFTKTPDSILDFYFSMPTLDVWINLHAKRDWDKNRKIDKNDMTDIAFLSMAIPYCDVVIAEKYFVNRAKELKFSEKYDTLISKDLEDLNEYLEKIV